MALPYLFVVLSLIWVLILKSWLNLPTVMCLIKCVTTNRIHCLSSLLPHSNPSNYMFNPRPRGHDLSLPSVKKVLFKIVSLWELSLCTDSLFFSLNMLDIYYCLILTVCAILLPSVCLLFCLFCVHVIQCGCHWSYLLTYLNQVSVVTTLNPRLLLCVWVILVVQTC